MLPRSARLLTITLLAAVLASAAAQASPGSVSATAVAMAQLLQTHC